MKKLPESEQEIMMIVWEYAEPVSRFQIEEKLNVEKNIAPSTILTLLTRLEKKGFIQKVRNGKSNLFIGIVAFMAYVVQKIMGKRLGHYWRKVVWILLTIKMCFPFWSVTEKFRQHFFIISMPAYYMGEQNQKTAIMTKIGNVSIREWMSGEKFLPYIWLAGMILCLLFHAIQYRIWKKRIFAECKRMQKNSVLEALKKVSEVCIFKNLLNF